jgi:hypothetical protein
LFKWFMVQTIEENLDIEDGVLEANEEFMS